MKGLKRRNQQHSLTTHCKALQQTDCCTHALGEITWNTTRFTENTRQHTATHRNTPQHNATHRNTPQYTATHLNTPQRIATHYNTPQHTATHRNTPQHTANTLQHADCNTLQHIIKHCSILHPYFEETPDTCPRCRPLHPLNHTATHCNTLQHIATHCNTLQHTATHCTRHRNTLQRTYFEVTLGTPADAVCNIH